MNPEAVLLSVVDALTAAGVPYLLAGSFSSNYYGIPRSTHDADFVVELQGRPIMSLQRHLDPALRIDPQVEFETVTGTRRNVVTARGVAFEVELFRLSDDAHDQQRFQRRRTVALLDRNISLPSPEDVIITKLRWLRKKDRDDIAGVIAVQGEALDWEYIYRWCDEHGTREVLEEIRSALPPLGDAWISQQNL
ncbi:MAG TPA: hypothetical protein PLF81_09665 [Candidatus Anammoximicrobium sp.]|nr:hypothetical protein [Candidatus Anammoximicrobium sp.]